MDSGKGSLRSRRRVCTLCATVGLFVVSCGSAGTPPEEATTSAPVSTKVNPARIDRARTDLPVGYETADLTGPVTPTKLWGLGAPWSADPEQCGPLADPAVDLATTKGWSASGTGGIVYAVVAASTAGLDPAVTGACGNWTLSAGQSNGRVTLTDAPAIDSAQTVAMATATTTVVEGGTETHSHADTVTAYLDGYVAFVTVVTDPGSPHPQLGADFANELIVKTVVALRS